MPTVSSLSLAAAIVGAMPWAGGCEPYPGIEERWDDDIVATAYDEDADFSAYRTFAVDPTVHVVEDLEDGGVGKDELPSRYAEPIVETIVDNMRARGYEEVDVAEGPDLGITVTALEREVSGTVSGWWGYYGGYWGYWGWGYYYPYRYDYSYRTGSLVTEMVDLADPLSELPEGGLPELDAGAHEQPLGLPVVWSSIAYQVLDGSGRPSLEWATESLDQAFVQSPYLAAPP